MRFDWSALLRLREELGENYLERIEACVEDGALDVLASAVAAGTGREVGDVLAESPPVNPTYAALIKALELAMFGEDGAGPAEGGEPMGKRIGSALNSMCFALRLKRASRGPKP